MSSAAAGSETRVGRMNCLTSVTRIWEGRAARVWGCSTPTGLLVCWRRHDCTLWGEGGGTGASAQRTRECPSGRVHPASTHAQPVASSNRSHQKEQGKKAEHHGDRGAPACAGAQSARRWENKRGALDAVPSRGAGRMAHSHTIQVLTPASGRAPQLPWHREAGTRHGGVPVYGDATIQSVFSVRRRGWGACHPGLAAHLRLHVSRVSTARGVQRGIWVATLLACDADTPQRLATACMNSKMGQGVRLVTRAGSGGVCRQRRVLVLGRGCGAAP